MSSEYTRLSTLHIASDVTLPSYVGVLIGYVEPTAAAITITLPDAAHAGMVILTYGKAGTKAASLATQSSQTINDQVSFPSMTMVGDGLILHTDGTNWRQRNPTLIYYGYY